MTDLVECPECLGTEFYMKYHNGYLEVLCIKCDSWFGKVRECIL